MQTNKQLSNKVNIQQLRMVASIMEPMCPRILYTRLKKSVHTDKTSSPRHISDQESQLKNNEYTQNYPLKKL